MINEKALCYFFLHRSLEVLVPKKRGEGFLKVPYGHHPVEGLSQIAYDTGYDVSGLDGTLSFEAGWKLEKEKMVAEVMPKLSTYYAVPYREATQQEIDFHFGVGNRRKVDA